MTDLDHWAGLCLIPLAIWVLISGVDDLVLAVAWIFGRLRPFPWPTEAVLAHTCRKRIAIFVPLWREAAVIADMLRHNQAAIRYDVYDFFVGVYPNDPGTAAAVRQAHTRVKNVHLALCPHDGPTTKADCLNWIYQRMLLYEEEHGVRFEIVVTHDAEDLIHPDSLRWINYFSSEYDMVQVPVLPLPTPVSHLTHGLYCDEFAECHTKDVPLRRMLGGFVPSCGVGTGFTREALELLAQDRSNRIFEPACLTEDYENGLRLHELRRRQIFIPVERWKNGFLATREYFPRTFRAAVRQRTRWTIGIALQTWERHGWRGRLGCKYWLWRDRKPLAGNIVSPLANLLFAYGAAAWATRGVVLANGILAETAWFALGLTAFHVAVRTGCSARVYGWRFAAAAPLRLLWGNWLNCFATVAAICRYARARFHRQPLVWLKTEHIYPNRQMLRVHWRRLGEILVDAGVVSTGELEQAAAACPRGVRLGEYLAAHGYATEADIYDALSLQHSLDLGKPEEVAPDAVGVLPAAVSRSRRVLAFQLDDGALHVAVTDAPDEGLLAELRRFCSLEMRFRLVTPRDFDELAANHLPPA